MVNEKHIQPIIKLNELVKKEMKSQAVSPVELAGRLHIAPSSVYSLLEKESMQVSRLKTICRALNVNFFRIVADQINIAEPLTPEIEELEEQVRDQKKENKTLKEVIALLAGDK